MRELILDFQEKPLLFPNCSSLEVLSLRGCCEWATDEVLNEVGIGGYVKSALLFRCFKVSDKGLIGFLKLNGSKLKTLELSGCTHITDKSLKAIARYCPVLVDLDLTRCTEVTDVGINMLTDLSLETLLLYADAQLGQSGMAALCHFRHLRRLDLCGIHSLNSGHLIRMIESTGDSLEYLNLSWCINVSDEAVAYIIDNQKLKNIQSLSFFGIKNFSSTAISAIVNYLRDIPSCRELDIRAIPSASNYTANDCQHLREIMPHLQEWKLHH